jgi:hypothetical protein
MATKGSGSSSMACGAVHRQTPEAGARCVNRARRDLCGVSGNGYPTATNETLKMKFIAASLEPGVMTLPLLPSVAPPVFLHRRQIIRKRSWT